MYKEARKGARLSIEEAAFQLNLAPRTLCKYEAGESGPAPETVLAMSRLYRAPWMTQVYCQEHCAIGQAYSYDLLTGVNMDPPSVMIKLLSEMTEAQEVLNKMLGLAVNKNSREDFKPDEWEQFTECLQEFLDVEHNIECLKISIGNWCDVSDMIKVHNKKCRDHGYVAAIKKEKTALPSRPNTIYPTPILTF